MNKKVKCLAFQQKFNKKENLPKESLKQGKLTNPKITDVDFLCIIFFSIFSFPEDGFFFFLIHLVKICVFIDFLVQGANGMAFGIVGLMDDFLLQTSQIFVNVECN